jgi:hypothetical protein
MDSRAPVGRDTSEASPVGSERPAAPVGREKLGMEKSGREKDGRAKADMSAI